MSIKKLLIVALAVISFMTVSAQITLSPVIDSAIEGLNENNITLIDTRLRSIISSNGMISGYGSRFVLACKVVALQREVSGSKMIQHLEVSFAIGDNEDNNCYGTTSLEVIGIGNGQEQAMTCALKNIKGNNQELRKIVAVAYDRIISYYEANGPAIIKSAEAQMAGQNWEDAIYELSMIPQECSCYPQAAALMSKVYTTRINHDANQVLAEAQSVWSADPNPGPAADKALEILSGIDTSAKCYPQAQTLMKKIESRVKTVTDQKYKDEVAMEKAKLNAETALEKARINAVRDVAVAYAKRRTVVVRNYYRTWW